MIGSKRSYATLPADPEIYIPEWLTQRNTKIRNERRAKNRVARASRKRNR